MTNDREGNCWLWRACFLSLALITCVHMPVRSQLHQGNERCIGQASGNHERLVLDLNSQIENLKRARSNVTFAIDSPITVESGKGNDLAQKIKLLSEAYYRLWNADELALKYGFDYDGYVYKRLAEVKVNRESYFMSLSAQVQNIEMIEKSQNAKSPQYVLERTWNKAAESSLTHVDQQIRASEKALRDISENKDKAPAPCDNAPLQKKDDLSEPQTAGQRTPVRQLRSFEERTDEVLLGRQIGREVSNPLAEAGAAKPSGIAGRNAVRGAVAVIAGVESSRSEATSSSALRPHSQDGSLNQTQCSQLLAQIEVNDAAMRDLSKVPGAESEISMGRQANASNRQMYDMYCQ